MNIERKKRKAAVVLSGGGARGAYEVGVLKALRKRNIEPEVYSGTSVGSFNCAMAVSGKTLEEMEDIWLSLTPSHVFTLRFDFKSLLTLDPRPPLRFALESAKVLGGLLNDSIKTGMSWWQLIDLDSILVDTSPLADLIRKNVALDALHNSNKEIYIALTRLKPTEGDPLEIVRGKQISHDHIYASCSLPLIFPQVSIGANTYCDGGVVMNSPLKPAIDAQAEEIYVVDLTPPPRTYQNATLPLAYQVMSAGFSSALHRDIESAKELNRMYLAAHMQGRLVQDKLEVAKMDAAPGKDSVIYTRHYRYLRIYVIRPEPDPKGIASFLDFDPQNAKDLIQQGEKVAEETLSRHYEKEMTGPSGKKKMVLLSR